MPTLKSARSGTRVTTTRWRRTLIATLVVSAILIPGQAAFACPEKNPNAANGSPTDRNISYVGRWDTSDPTAYVPGWAGAYLRTGFTGTTVKLKQRSTIDLYYSIDGAAYTYLSKVSGTVDLTPTPLTSGQHTLRVSYRIVAGSYHGDAVFQGLVLDAGATTRRIPTPRQLVEFIGDSITVGQTSSQVALTSYPWLIGEQLGTRHTQIAQGGACLRELTAAESTRGIACVGLQQRFTNTSATDTATAWDFTRYQADVVVINLGTNDTSHGVVSADFQAGYLDLLHTVRAKYPHAQILALRTFIGRWATETQAAVAAAQAAGDQRITYVDTTGWLTAEGRTDSVHPNDLGHQTIAGLLAPIVAERLKRCDHDRDHDRDQDKD
jgi:lysophospholipase L1-like esterase